MHPALRKPIVSKRNARPDENVILDRDTVPHVHAVLDGDPVANGCARLNEAVRTDVAVTANGCAIGHNDKLPDTRTRANAGCSDVSRRVDDYGSIGHL
jgi:hypothetical protein